jgi:hypothetical protein
MFSKLPKKSFSAAIIAIAVAAANNQVIFLNVFMYFKTIFFFLVDLARIRPNVYEYEKQSEIY